MKHRTSQSGFSLIELLVAATIFSFVVTGVTGLFMQALDMQRRASGIQKIQENAQYTLESVTREVRVSRVVSGNTGDCNPGNPATQTMTLEHPSNGTVVYEYDRSGGIGVIRRSSSVSGGVTEPITSTDVDITKFAFCVSGTGPDGQQARVTIPMTLESRSGRASTRVSVSVQSTIISRDVTEDLL